MSIVAATFPESRLGPRWRPNSGSAFILPVVGWKEKSIVKPASITSPGQWAGAASGLPSREDAVPTAGQRVIRAEAFQSQQAWKEDHQARLLGGEQSVSLEGSLCPREILACSAGTERDGILKHFGSWYRR